jgi:U3 small nucleolar RNA-associated protein 21
MAAGGHAGVITVWNLEDRRLHTVIKDAHNGMLSRLYFFPGEPVLMSSAADNSVKHHIFDNDDGTARLLRFRSGHAAPPRQLIFYGPEGRVLLSAAGDQDIRVFSIIQDQQSRELSQVRKLRSEYRW